MRAQPRSLPLYDPGSGVPGAHTPPGRGPQPSHGGPDPDRVVGVGRDRAADRAAAAALEGAADPRLLVVFASTDLAATGAAVAAVAPAGVPVVGCAARGRDEVVVAALGGAGFSVSTAAASATHGSREAGAEAAACLGDVADRPYQALMLFVTGADGDPQHVVRGAYSVAGAGVPLVGGGGDPLSSGDAVLLHGGEATSSGVVAAAIGSDVPFGVGVRHGRRRGGDPLLVTRAEGPRVLELDGRTALEAYRERLPGAPADRDALIEAARAHPLGLTRRAGEEQVRTIVDVDFGDGSVLFLGEVPEGGLAWVMEGGDDVAAAEAACAEALAPLGGAAPRGLLVFESVLRAGVPDDVIARYAGGAPVARGGTVGQVARMRGLVGFHNQAFAALAIA